MLKKLFFVNLFILIILGSSFKLSYSKDILSTTSSFISSIIPYKEINNEDDLLGIVEISKIGVYEKIYSISSNKNNVNQHVSILKESVLPSKDYNNNSIIFLAAHSGSGRVAYFKDLDKLEIGDLIYFYYQNNQYTYQVSKIFEEEKDGDIELNKSSSQQLILTTCSPNHADKQLIVDTKLIQKKES